MNNKALVFVCSTVLFFLAGLTSAAMGNGAPAFVLALFGGIQWGAVCVWVQR